MAVHQARQNGERAEVANSIARWNVDEAGDGCDTTVIDEDRARALAFGRDDASGDKCL